MFNVPEKSQEEKTREALMQINDHSNASLENYKNNYLTAFNLLWHNVSATPQQIFEMLGVEGSNLFVTAQKVITHIQQLDPTYLPPSAPYNFTINEDGSVTLGEMTDEEKVKNNPAPVE